MDDLVQEIWEQLLEHDQELAALDPFDFALGFALGRGVGLDERLEIAKEIRTLWDAAQRLDSDDVTMEIHPPPQIHISQQRIERARQVVAMALATTESEQ